MKLRNRILSFAIIVSLFFIGASNTDTSPYLVTYAKTDSEIRSEIDALNSKMDNVKKEQQKLETQIKNAKASASTLASEITVLTNEIDIIDEQIIIITNLLEQYELLIAEQEVKIVELEEKIAHEKKMLDEMIRLSFEYGGAGNALEFIFSAENFSDLISRMDLLSYHLKYNNKVIENYGTTLTEMEESKAEYQASLETMSDFKTKQEALRVDLEAKQLVAAEKRSALMINVKEYQKELDEKQKHIDALNKQIKDLAAMFSKEDKSVYSGSFFFPLPQGVYRITSYYGTRTDPFTGAKAYHNGYDFACAKGTKIFAADDGTVVIANWNGGYGNCVTINHGGGIMTLYGHCSSLNVVAGQKVKRGDVIAYVGSTGRSTGNHLHFTVYKDGNLADPAPYLGI